MNINLRCVPNPPHHSSASGITPHPLGSARGLTLPSTRLGLRPRLPIHSIASWPRFGLRPQSPHSVTITHSHKNNKFGSQSLQGCPLGYSWNQLNRFSVIKNTVKQQNRVRGVRIWNPTEFIKTLSK